MLQKSLYLYAMLLFSYTAIQAVEKCPESNEVSIAKNKFFNFPNYMTDEEVLASYALLEDDNEELERLTEDLASLGDQDENNPKNLFRNL